MAATAVLIVGRPNDDPLGPTGTVGLCVERYNKSVVLVDAGDPWNGQELQKRLEFFGVQNAVTHVVVTHGHLDHCANLGLFPNSIHIMDTDVGVKRGGKAEYSEAPHWPYKVSENVEIMKLSGHTASDTVVVVHDQYKKTVVFSGDLVEDSQDFLNFQDSQLDLLENPDPDELLLSQEYIFSSGDTIVPGHGPSFKNPHRSYFLFFSFWRRFMN